MNELLAGLAGLAAWQVLAVVAGVGLVEGTGVLGYVVPGLASLVAAGSLASGPSSRAAGSDPYEPSCRCSPEPRE